MELPLLGDEVLIRGKVISVPCAGRDDVAPEYQTVRVQAPDGQGIETNLSNLAEPVPTKAVAAPPKTKAVTTPAETK